MKKQKKQILNQKKAGSLPRWQNKNNSQNNKEFINNLAAGGFAKLTK